MKIAVFVPNWIGDAVMATPAIRAIREHFDQAEIVAVVRPYVAEVFAGLCGRSAIGHPLVDRLFRYDPSDAEAGRRGWRLAASMRSEQFDLAVLFPNSLRSAWMAWVSGAHRRVGINRDRRGWMLTDRIPARPRHEPHPALDEYLRIAEHLGCQNLSRRTELVALPEDEARLAQFWRNVHPRLDARRRETGVVCLNPGGAFGSAKHWPAASFAGLARRIAEDLGKIVLVLCGPAEREIAGEIVRLAEHPDVVSLAGEQKSEVRLRKSEVSGQRSGVKSPGSGVRGQVSAGGTPLPLREGPGEGRGSWWLQLSRKLSRSSKTKLQAGARAKATSNTGFDEGAPSLSLGLTKAAIKSADLLVTTDSGPRHFAPPFGVPVVTLFGPTHIAWSETYYERAIHLQLDVDCGPCQQRTCPLVHHRCMTELSVERVFAAAVSLLDDGIQTQRRAS